MFPSSSEPGCSVLSGLPPGVTTTIRGVAFSIEAMLWPGLSQGFIDPDAGVRSSSGPSTITPPRTLFHSVFLRRQRRPGGDGRPLPARDLRPRTEAERSDPCRSGLASRDDFGFRSEKRKQGQKGALGPPWRENRPASATVPASVAAA